MGAGQEDTDPTAKGRREPDASSTESSQEGDGPAPVDFDALHAALGAMPPPEVTSSPDLPQPRGLTLEAAPSESMGRSSATYASASPHAVPKAHVASEAPDMPAVIVHAEEHVPPAAPSNKMTVPMVPSPARGSGPHGAAPPMAHPFTPPPFPVQAIPNGSHTIRMPDRPIPRRARVPTIVVRPRGPSTRQKLAAFIVMFLLFTASGVAVLVFLRPGLLGLNREPLATTPSATASSPTATATATVIATAATAPPATVTAPPSIMPSATTTALPPASVKPKPKPLPKPAGTVPNGN